MKKMFTRMGDIMQEIINEIKEGGVLFIDHTTSLLRVIATMRYSHFQGE
jgi:Holliday junction resolvasome RuvABC ATP-dependent DNA helicase subunit